MNNKILTAYFSASGVTAKAAKQLAAMANTDLFEIKPSVPYSEADLNWMDKQSRSSIEMNKLEFRPEISEKLGSIEKYDIVLLCFPIWWYVAPTIINTFLEGYDFSNKTVVLFATSGGSGFGKTVEGLRVSLDASAKIVEGKVLNGKISKEDVQKIINSL